ncbi:hypothetical protein cyc_02283 [Cyclospora cayetanensis]|uniref:Uncharacterized protein n=1 Tax=Cyclospora cayetanensis TaxID=88456 RepID=A0A1D3D5E7_9EIME|nr:hypothetical protein cyc_02283 [Cyclospora cayetanensis]
MVETCAESSRGGPQGAPRGAPRGAPYRTEAESSKRELFFSPSGLSADEISDCGQALCAPPARHLRQPLLPPFRLSAYSLAAPGEFEAQRGGQKEAPSNQFEGRGGGPQRPQEDSKEHYFSPLSGGVGFAENKVPKECKNGPFSRSSDPVDCSTSRIARSQRDCRCGDSSKPQEAHSEGGQKEGAIFSNEAASSARQTPQGSPSRAPPPQAASIGGTQQRASAQQDTLPKGVFEPCASLISPDKTHRSPPQSLGTHRHALPAPYYPVRSYSAEACPHFLEETNCCACTASEGSPHSGRCLSHASSTLPSVSVMQQAAASIGVGPSSSPSRCHPLLASQGALGGKDPSEGLPPPPLANHSSRISEYEPPYWCSTGNSNSSNSSSSTLPLPPQDEQIVPTLAKRLQQQGILREAPWISPSVPATARSNSPPPPCSISCSSSMTSAEGGHDSQDFCSLDEEGKGRISPAEQGTERAFHQTSNKKGSSTFLRRRPDRVVMQRSNRPEVPDFSVRREQLLQRVAERLRSSLLLQRPDASALKVPKRRTLADAVALTAASTVATTASDNDRDTDSVSAPTQDATYPPQRTPEGAAADWQPRLPPQPMHQDALEEGFSPSCSYIPYVPHRRRSAREAVAGASSEESVGPPGEARRMQPHRKGLSALAILKAANRLKALQRQRLSLRQQSAEEELQSDWTDEDVGSTDENTTAKWTEDFGKVHQVQFASGV